MMEHKRKRGECYIETICCDAAFRGKGIGKQLMQAAEGLARDRHCTVGVQQGVQHCTAGVQWGCGNVKCERKLMFPTEIQQNVIWEPLVCFGGRYCQLCYLQWNDFFQKCDIMTGVEFIKDEFPCMLIQLSCIFSTWLWKWLLTIEQEICMSAKVLLCNIQETAALSTMRVVFA